MDKLVPVLSLVVAALAVFVGPLISLAIARRQMKSSLEVANKQITAPMRQAWINNLRELLAELTSSAVHFYATGFEDREDKEYQRLTHLEYKIKLMLNVKEEDHKRLDDLIRVMISALSQGKRGDAAFADAHLAIIDLSRQLLKREWNRVKEPIEIA